MTDEIHTRLVEWGRWARTKQHYDHCKSIEHRYRSPQCWYPPEPKYHINELDALEIELTMRHLATQFSKMLKLKYIGWFNDELLCKRLQISQKILDERLANARLMISNILRLTKRKRYAIVSTQFDFRQMTSKAALG